MQRFFVLFAALTFLTACEQTDNLVSSSDGGSMFKEKPTGTIDKTAIHGLWESNGDSDAKMTQKIRIRFDEFNEKVTLASECKYVDGTTLYVKVDSPAEFVNNTANVVEAQQDYATQKKANFTYDCFANLTTGLIKMGLNGKIVFDVFVLTKIGN